MHRPAFGAKEREVRTIRISDHPECRYAVQLEYHSDEPRYHRVRRKRRRLNPARFLSDQTAEKSIRVLGDTRLRTKTRSHGATRRHEKSSIAGKAVLKSFTLKHECEGDGERFHVCFTVTPGSVRQARCLNRANGHEHFMVCDGFWFHRLKPLMVWFKRMFLSGSHYSGLTTRQRSIHLVRVMKPDFVSENFRLAFLGNKCWTMASYH